jgi:hypothetical protein
VLVEQYIVAESMSNSDSKRGPDQAEMDDSKMGTLCKCNFCASWMLKYSLTC